MSIGIVVQGPFHEQCRQSLDEYSKYGEVVISTYRNSGSSIPLTYYPHINVLENTLPKVDWYNVNNIYYQAYSTYRGLRVLNTEYTIKVRANESYSDISKFVQKMLDNPDKVITNNVAFPRTSIQPLHPSDHMIGCKTWLMQDTFSDVMAWCKTLPPMSTNLFGGERGLPWIGHVLAEQIICIYFLFNKGVDGAFSKDHSIPTLNKVMREHFDVVPVEDLGEVVHSISVPEGRNFRKNGEGLYGYEHESIRNMDEL
jgi:hypothetical protein